jgi:hypothetical protein
LNDENADRSAVLGLARMQDINEQCSAIVETYAVALSDSEPIQELREALITDDWARRLSSVVLCAQREAVAAGKSDSTEAIIAATKAELRRHLEGEDSGCEFATCAGRYFVAGCMAAGAKAEQGCAQ